MTSTPTTTTNGSSGHPIEEFVARLRHRLTDLADAPTWSMDDDMLRRVLPELTAAAAQLAELTMRVAGQAETNAVGDRSGAATTAAWWAHQSQLTQAEARRHLRLAAALDRPVHAPVRAALAQGAVLVDQAAVIVDAVDGLPADTAPEVVGKAVAYLLTEAKALDAKRLRVLSRRLLEVVDPDAADAHEAALLETEEAAAHAAATLTMVDDGHGKTHGRFTLPTAQAGMFKKALLAIAAPKHRTTVDGHPPIPGTPMPQRLGQAFVEYVERYPTDRLPRTGGLNATAVVHLPFETMQGLGKAAELDTGHRLSPGQTRRLLCEAGILPVVLGGDSVVLDQGRARRFHQPPQRIAIAARHRTCVAEGCDWPAHRCHIHHPEPWSHGGRTDRDGIPLCPRHHHLAHDSRYHTTHLPDGGIRFHRRT